MGHLVISGPGRAGTTLLVQILDRLGFDTGADQLEYFDHANAGLEAEFVPGEAPYVVKKPDLIFTLTADLQAGTVTSTDIDWLVIPLRDLDQATASRLAVTGRTGDPEGALTGTKRPRSQREALAVGVYSLLLASAAYEIPTLLLDYPRFALDPAYAYRRLQPALGQVTEAQFAAAHEQTVDPTRIHSQPITVPKGLGVRTLMRRIRRKLSLSRT